jgi:hypothetical protein
MSDLSNDILLDNLKERLEALKPYMDTFNYQELVSDTQRLLRDNDWAAAGMVVLNSEQDYALVIALSEAQDKEDLLAEDID